MVIASIEIRVLHASSGMAICRFWLDYILRTTDGGMTWANDDRYLSCAFAPTGLSFLSDPLTAWYADRPFGFIILPIAVWLGRTGAQ